MHSGRSDQLCLDLPERLSSSLPLLTFVYAPLFDWPTGSYVRDEKVQSALPFFPVTSVVVLLRHSPNHSNTEEEEEEEETRFNKQLSALWGQAAGKSPLNPNPIPKQVQSLSKDMLTVPLA